MKLMKHITIALVLCAIPAMALGQVSVTCDECKHMVPIFMGDGGVIAEADGADMVSFLSTCGGVTSWGSKAPNADGVVALSFQDEGIACMGDDGTFSIGPVMDGGWYWVTRGTNSAIGSLVHDDVVTALAGSETNPTDAGMGVMMTAGDGAVMLEETATGRVGILSTFLPVIPDDPVRVCGYAAGAVAAPLTTAFVRVDDNCTLGNGGNTILATTTNSLSGAVSRVMDMGSIARPAGAGSFDMVIDLWGNMSGHFLADDATATDARLGNPGALNAMFGPVATRNAVRMTGVTYAVARSGGAGPGATNEELASGSTVAGVTRTDGTNVTTLTIANETTNYCTATASHAATFVVTVSITADGAGEITPPMGRNATTGAVGTFTFTLTCPAGSSANQGQELVPDNPFPTTR